MAKKTKKKVSRKKASSKNSDFSVAKFPRHDVQKALRIPRAILEQNAGKNCSEEEAAKFVGVGYNGPFKVEISSSLKYGFLERPSAGKIQVSNLARKILRPQNMGDETEGLREAILNAPEFSDVYKHYRGENLPDSKFFENTLVDTFNIPLGKVGEFSSLFLESLQAAKLVEESNGKTRVLDVTDTTADVLDKSDRIKKLEKEVSVNANDSCFVMMPFAPPIGGYYQKIYEPAILKAGLRPVRADNEIFGTGKIIDQIWTGLNAAKVLVAELTTRNANVFYELGLAHALKKPVVLVAANENDVPFDLQHIRVIYYDVNDPFWGSKLIDKIAENILSAIKNPAEAIFKGED